MRRGGASIVANPVLVGATTMLVVVVAVFLAYNANNGLPFVPTQTLYAETPNGAEVVPGVEVRQGGFRIGSIPDVKPKRLRNGRVGAVLELKLDQTAGPFPRDSRIIIRPRGPLAQKIVEFVRGDSRQMIADGGRVPVQQSEIRTDLDELYTLYDAPTREGTRKNLDGFGTAFAGRGQDLNETIRRLPEFLGALSPVMRNLSDPETGLARFFNELNDFTRVIAPVSREFARGFRLQADTYEAIGRDPGALRATIEKSPATLADSERSFRTSRPFLRETTALSRELNLASRELRTALPPLNRAIEVATPVTRRSVALNDRLVGAFAALRDLTGRADDQRRAARPDRDGHDAAADAALPRARSSPSATTGTSSGPSPPSTSRRPTRPAARSACCSTPATGRTTTSPTAWAPTSTPPGAACSRSAPTRARRSASTPTRTPRAAWRSTATGRPTACRASRATRTAPTATTTRRTVLQARRGRSGQRPGDRSAQGLDLPALRQERAWHRRPERPARARGSDVHTTSPAAARR
jgi:ABC-type transporter Mla subunit MlaD